ncbi:MAG: translation elongation factor Ts [Phycisphaerales bacterium]|nr:translation elongation factor Ts [Phycisphaerales bacterium]
MAAINAAMVKSLRERSGLPMMDCKQALMETNGDESAAFELLRKRGAMAAEKKAGRTTAEGRIGSYSDKQAGKAAIVEMLCETAPVANNPDFRQLVDQLAKHVALTGAGKIETLGEEKFSEQPDITITELLNDLINRIRENMKLSRVVRMTGRSATYVHHTGKVGVIIGVEGDGGDDALLNDVCMHIAALQPEALCREELPAELVKKEEDIAREQIRASGKPENMIDKILVGKMSRWYGEHVLLEQPFVKDDKKTVGKLLEEAGVKLTGYTRLQVGEA